MMLEIQFSEICWQKHFNKNYANFKYNNSEVYIRIHKDSTPVNKCNSPYVLTVNNYIRPSIAANLHVSFKEKRLHTEGWNHLMEKCVTVFK